MPDERPKEEQDGDNSNPIVTQCPSCGQDIRLDRDLAVEIIIDKIKNNLKTMRDNKEHLLNYSTYAIGEELIRHLSLYLEERNNA